MYLGVITLFVTLIVCFAVALALIINVLAIYYINLFPGEFIHPPSQYFFSALISVNICMCCIHQMSVYYSAYLYNTIWSLLVIHLFFSA
jgi:hypothetical protein